MNQSTISTLDKEVSELTEQTSAPEKLDKLTKAFGLFTQEAQRLELEYKNLQNQYQEVNLELDKTNKELKHKVLELNHVSSYLNNLLQHIHQGLLFVDLSGSICAVNPAATSMLAKTEASLLDQRFHDLFDDNIFGFSLRESLKQKQGPELAYASYEEDSKHTPIELEISTSFVDKGPSSHHGLLILLRDITEISRLQMLNNRSDRLKDLGEMAAKVAHEIRNPLGGIEGFATLLARDLKDHPTAAPMLENILSGTKILSRLVSRILDYSKPLELCLKKTTLSHVVKQAIDMLSVDPKFKGKHQLVFNNNEPELSLFIDPQLTLSVLLNLLLNAAESMAKPGKITASIRKQEEWISVAIEDEGIGIPESDREKIFSPLFTTKQKGNGLGLSEVYKIMQLHGGECEVFPRKNKGTYFAIKFPIRVKRQH